MNSKPRDYHAHFNPLTNQYQSNYVHNSDTAKTAIKKNPIPFLENIIWFICSFHDAGKYTTPWQEYFQERIKNLESLSGYKEDHTTAGGRLIKEIFMDSYVSELIQTAIYSHHGLQDCIGLDDSVSLFKRRDEKAEKISIRECREAFYLNNDKNEIEQRCAAAKAEWVSLRNEIQCTLKNWGAPGFYGNRDFFLGMYERLLISLLIDADRRDTEDFMSGCDAAPYFSEKELHGLWQTCYANVEKRIAKFTDRSGINACRSEISEICNIMAKESRNLYKFTVSTGLGKTLSSLRFAVAHAEKFHKKRIFYIAPFHSIVEQNSKEIKDALGMPEIVLEHHCNIIMETEEAQARYDRLTEDWSSPVVVTTAVQFLNTLFTAKTGNVRRMHSLCDSVIIMDEVQALPLKLLELFNMAVNFLTEFADTTVVLCTATQPLLDALPKNRLRPSVNMIEQSEKYREKLRRTEILDCTEFVPGGMNIEEAAGFILDKAAKYKKVLFIVNTKNCAVHMFRELKKRCGDTAVISHLSTCMCPEHRSSKLNAIKEELGSGRMQICISTQLIEAGVDISFPCVVRSLAGLDSIIQSAGRCNRHKELETGCVYIVRMNQEAENLTRLKDIWIAQEAMCAVLKQFQRMPETLDFQLDSAKAISMYFECYFKAYIDKEGDPMSFPVTVKGVPTTIVDLLSDNAAFVKRRTGQILKQAFKTAGEEFEVIAETGKISVIVPYREFVGERIEDLENPYRSVTKKKKILRELQPYTVSLSQTERNKIGDGIYGAWENRILVLKERFYDEEIGIVTDPGPMPDLQL